MQSLQSIRPFSISSPLQKKRKIAAPSNSPTWEADKASSSSQPSSTSDENPLDLTALIASYTPIDAHFKSQLQVLTHGGRFNPASLGALPVAIKEDDGSTATYPLRELAQVVPRSGRAISLLLNDRAYVKPVMSAVQASPDFNQQPQRAEDNDLELLLKVELERREDVVRRVRDACQTWRERVRQARTKHEKLIGSWRKANAVLPDAARKAEKDMQKLQDRKMKEIEQEETKTIRQLDRN